MRNKFRIFRQDNYLEIRPLNSDNVFTGHVKNVRVFRDNTGKSKFRFFGIKNWSPTVFLDLTQIVDQNGDSYTLSSWEEFYNTNTGNFSAGGGDTPFDPSLYDLKEFQNGSDDLFIRESDLLTYTAISTVETYDDLPDASDVPNELYIVENEQGTSWLPGSIGGTYYPEGVYFSNGVKWVYQKSPYQATQLEVNTGVNTDKFVTSNTLAESTYVNDFVWTLDFMDGTLITTIYAPKNFKINSLTDIVNTPTKTILVNGSSYTLGSTITQGDEISVEVSAIGVINLNSTLV
jgi:hypothetical protein